ncbi:MAG: hypothetical protein EBX40_01985 [Gammaproteobacteria bacterium]|nr:hypothetical protein [Gammaproteobacteria bacterium]
MRLLLNSREVIDPVKGGLFMIARYEINQYPNELRGAAWIEGLEHLRVDIKESIVGNIVAETKSLKFWLEAGLINLVVEFDEGVSAKNG